tara:strand:+ start:841 stop:1725 length:885 start_codon:yes stop_codon:yes gene_type:complete
MRNIYDKLLLLAACLLLTAGFYIYMSTGGRAVLNVRQSQQSIPYTSLKAEINAPSTVNWSAPEEQSTGWTYDVFTPPKIYLDENGQFVNEGWKIYEPVPFGVTLVNLEKIPYRIQLEGYIEEDPMDASKSLLLLYNEETDRSLRTRVGRLESAAEIEVIEFNIKRLRDANGNPYKEVFAQIKDLRSGKIVTLKNDERLFLKDFVAELRAESNAEQKIQLSRVGEEFEIADAQYRLESVDFEQVTVSVYKFATDKSDAETRSLNADSSETSGADVNAVEDGSAANASPTLDSLFN